MKKGMLVWYMQWWDIVQSVRKRALSALPNEESSKVVVCISCITRRSHYSHH